MKHVEILDFLSKLRKKMRSFNAIQKQMKNNSTKCGTVETEERLRNSKTSHLTFFMYGQIMKNKNIIIPLGAK